jgi:hypothetical protein
MLQLGMSRREVRRWEQSANFKDKYLVSEERQKSSQGAQLTTPFRASAGRKFTRIFRSCIAVFGAFSN